MILRDVRVLDGRGGIADASAVQVNARTGRVEAVGDPSPRSDERVVDLPGHTVLPGLVDAHVHYSLSADPTLDSVLGLSEAELALVEAANARRTLESGVTAVRNMGARDVDVHVRDAIERDAIAGPRTVTSGRSITVTGGHGHHMGREADGPVDCRRAVREQHKRGADFVKFMATGGVTTPGSEPKTVAFTDEEMAALVETAHRHDMPVATHAHGAAGVKAAVAAGVDTVEHGTFLDDEAVAMLADADVTLVPTLSAGYNIVANADRVAADAARQSEDVQARHAESFARAHEAGVTIAAGTDAGTPFNEHGANSTELEFMVENGMDPTEAITAMTATAAETVGLDDCGVVEAGAHADLLVVEGDPTTDVSLLRDPVAVLQGGTLVSGALPDG